MNQILNLALDPVINFGKVTLVTGYDSSAQSVALLSGHGARLPDPSTDGPFNLVWWNSSKYADPSDDPNVEIVRCTLKAIDSLATIIRGQEGTSASNKNSLGDTYKMILAPTRKMFTDIPSDAQSKVNTHAILTSSVHNFDVSGNAPAQSHGNEKHSTTYAPQSSLDSHTGATAAHGSSGAIVGQTTLNAHTGAISSVHNFDVSGNAPAQSHGNEKHSAAYAPQSSLDSAVPAGVIFPYAGPSAPIGFLLCDGSAVDRTTYAALFAAIGTAYGPGNGSTTFNVPDFLGRTIVGAGLGTGLTNRTRGDKGGEETHILTTAELASHQHGAAGGHTHASYGSHSHNSIGDHTHNLGIEMSGYQGSTPYRFVTYKTSGTGATDAGGGHTHSADGGHTHDTIANHQHAAAGSGAAHQNMQPFGVVNYIIKT